MKMCVENNYEITGKLYKHDHSIYTIQYNIIMCQIRFLFSGCCSLAIYL